MTVPALTPLASTPDLFDRVYEALLDSICSGACAPGERLTQDGVAERLGVSRQPVLQAFRVLARQGLILATPNRKGVLVAPLDPGFLRQLYALRGALDGLAAREAAARPRPELRAPGEALLRAGRAAARAGDLPALVEADLALHRFVYEASGNPLLIRTATVHWHHTRRAMTAYLRPPTAPSARAWAEHERLLDAIVAGDAARAEAIAREHAEQSGAALAARAATPGPAGRPKPPRSATHHERAANEETTR